MVYEVIFLSSNGKKTNCQAEESHDRPVQKNSNGMDKKGTRKTFRPVLKKQAEPGWRSAMLG
jgi:hypothetical protein